MRSGYIGLTAGAAVAMMALRDAASQATVLPSIRPKRVPPPVQATATPYVPKTPRTESDFKRFKLAEDKRQRKADKLRRLA